MPAVEVDAVAERDGFAGALVESGLADVHLEGLRLKGDERAFNFAAFRIEQKRKSDLAVQARIGNGKDNEVPAGLPGGDPVGHPSISISSDLDLFPDLSPESGNSTSKAKLAREAAASWQAWFNQHFARRVEVTQALSKQVGALMARGWQENPDLRGVALYLESLWAGDAKMAQYLVPSTILRPTKFEERLALAKEWRPKHWGIAPVIASPRVQVPVTQGPKAEYVDKAEIASLALELAKMKGAPR